MNVFGLKAFMNCSHVDADSACYLVAVKPGAKMKKKKTTSVNH